MIYFACRSDPGRRHNENQDRWYADPDRNIFLVADGMANAIASQMVVDLLPLLLEDLPLASADPTDPAYHEQLQALLRDLSRQVLQEMVEHDELGLGTTLVLVLVHEPKALVVHVGDSRVYLYRSGRLEPLTRDHSLVQHLLDEGVISPEDARRARSNGGPTRFLGQVDEVEAGLRVIELHTGDQLLLCSDGLTEMIEETAIQETFERRLCPEDTCAHLVDAANAAGGWDNVTVLILAVNAEGTPGAAANLSPGG
jgi:protein phosphatase